MDSLVQLDSLLGTVSEGADEPLNHSLGGIGAQQSKQNLHRSSRVEIKRLFDGPRNERIVSTRHDVRASCEQDMRILYSVTD